MITSDKVKIDIKNQYELTCKFFIQLKPLPEVKVLTSSKSNLQGKRITQAFFTSAESSTKYFFTDMKLPDIENTIFLLKEEEATFLQIEQQASPVFRTNATIPLSVTKFGNSRR
jgi:hypothetical protein